MAKITLKLSILLLFSALIIQSAHALSVDTGNTPLNKADVEKGAQIFCDTWNAKFSKNPIKPKQLGKFVFVEGMFTDKNWKGKLYGLTTGTKASDQKSKVAVPTGWKLSQTAFCHEAIHQAALITAREKDGDSAHKGKYWGSKFEDGVKGALAAQGL